MDEDKFALVEKIIKDIDNVLSKNAELCDFDVVPVESNIQNKSPVLHLENCLGLESWCVKHVYMYCYSELMDKYFTKPKRKTLKVSAVNSDRLARLLNVTLLLNPEINSLWNKRREMVLKLLLDRDAELRFTKLVLSRKPKCNDAFAYRRWLLEAKLSDDNIQSQNIQQLNREELRICKLTSDKSPNNYHSWNHRIWYLNKLKELEKQFDLHLLYKSEYEFSEDWTSKHISDFSGFHYRQFCIKNLFTMDDKGWRNFVLNIDVNLPKLFTSILSLNLPNNLVTSQETLISYSDSNLMNFIFGHAHKNCDCQVNDFITCKKLEILFRELSLNNELLRFYKNHETLWYHRRFIVHEIICVMYDRFGLIRHSGSLVKNSCGKCNVSDVRQKQAKIVKYDCNRIYSCVLFTVLLSHEKSFIEERQNDCDNYSDRHEKYLRFVEGLNNVM